MTGHSTETPLLVTLTGGIASGKTAVSDRLAALGAAVIDTDLIAREVVAPGSPGLDQVVDAFGREILDDQGALDRAALRERIFQSEADRHRLEDILHPLIESEARRRIRQHDNAPYIVLVVPLLVETGLFGEADRVVVVDVPESVQVERLMARDAIERAQAESMLAAQASREERLAAATDVIDNGGSLDELDAQVGRLHRRLLELSSRRRNPSTRRR